MVSAPSRSIPRINFVALLASALLLVSVFLDWWGIDVSNGAHFRWPLWSGPNTISIESAQSAQPLVTYGPIVGALVICAAALAILGTIPLLSRLLIGSSILAIISPIVYLILANYAVSAACNGVPNCISGPFGTKDFGFGFILTWGFQQGFYVEIVGAVLSIIAIAFQRTFLASKNP